MASGLGGLLDPTGFPPRWQCGSWSSQLGWTHIISDGAIFAAYAAIPVLLIYFIRKRPDVPFPRIFWLFGAFILLCGVGHLIEAFIFWNPVYRLAGANKVLTAAASWVTVAALIPIIPKALSLPGIIKQNEELERRVAERTLQVQRHAAELERANVALSQSNRDLKQFAYVASHDLQAPLRGIAGFAQLLKSRYSAQLDDTAGEWLDKTIDSAEHMQTLIREILAYSQLDAAAPELESIALNDVMDVALRMLEPTIDEKGAEITIDELPVVLGEKAHLVQLLRNLLENSLKYCTAETPRVRVWATEGAEDWTLHVGDNGIGIEPQYRDEIFEVFKRLHSSREYSGTGIGLAICQRVVERHHGRIWFDSKPGEGTTFHFTLLKQDEPAAVLV